MKRGKTKPKPYRKQYQSSEEERQSWVTEKNRLEFRLSHQNECFINSVRQEEMELAFAIDWLRRSDELTEDVARCGFDLSGEVTIRTS